VAERLPLVCALHPRTVTKIESFGLADMLRSDDGASMAEICNALTVDVEDYFQVSALAPHIGRAEWEHIPCRVERNIDLILQLLAESASQATFFTLGWIAERYPGLVQRIAAEGHELASHGYAHQRASDQSRAEFCEDIDQPRIAGTSLKTRIRHYVNLHRTQPRLRRLLRDFTWRRIDRTFLQPTIA
jgi:hypothetical protein